MSSGVALRRDPSDGDATKPRTSHFGSRPTEADDLTIPTWVPGSVVASVADALGRLHLDLPAVLGITSASRGEGRTTIAMAAAIAEHFDHGYKTVLVDLDLPAPTLEHRVEAPPGPGLADYLRGTAELSQCIRWCQQSLGVLPAGDVGPDVDVLISAALRMRVLDEVARLADVVVVDLPPLPPNGPGGRFASACDAVMLVVRAGATTNDSVRRAVRSLPRPPAVLLNRAAPEARRR